MRDDLVTRVVERQRDVEERLFSACGYRNLVRLDVHTVLLDVPSADSLAKLEDAARGCVPGKILADGRHGGGLGVLRGIEVRLAGTEIQDVDPGPAHALSVRAYLERRGLGNGTQTICDRHTSSLLAAEAARGESPAAHRNTRGS